MSTHSTLTPTQRALLLERARRLAVRPAEAGDSAYNSGHNFGHNPASNLAQLELLTFRVGVEWAALELASLAGILVPEITPLPDVSALVLGIQSVRGAVVCVLDLRTLLELAPDEQNPGQTSSESEARVLLLDTPQGTVGFRVDGVGETRTAPTVALTAPVSARGGVRGVLEGRILVLEAAGLLERMR